MEHPLTPGIANKLRQGDSKAIETVVKALHAPIYRYLVCRGSTVSQAEELTAETFFQVLKSILNFRGDDIGRIGMSGGSLCGITISGVDDLEFSLKHIKNAEPIGLLQRGTLTIKKDDAVITISGVRNGAQKVTLDGPYKVWVRSTGKDVKGKAFLEMMAVQIAAMRERKSEGDATLTDEMMKKVTRMVDKKRPMLMSAFTTDVKDRDLEK